MRISLVVFPVVIGWCAHAKPSRWELGGELTVCTCIGRERQPTPSEAASWREGESVQVYCEGTVTDCAPGAWLVPGSDRGRSLKPLYQPRPDG
jgi:hypothetical protein